MQLTTHQNQAFDALKTFVQAKAEQVFILRGYAGTGKTTLVSFLLDWLKGIKNIEPVLLASTGRAARILKQKTKAEATTVHSQIYAFNVIEEKAGKKKDAWQDKTGQLVLNFSLKPPTTATQKLYIIDEASMLSYQPQQGEHIAQFGSGNVLSDFLKFAGKNKVIFVGDPAQLPPPVGINPFSAALAPNYLSTTFQKKVAVGSLTEILRQKEGGDILGLATQIRSHFKSKRFDNWETLMNQPGQGIFHPFNQQILFKRYLPLLQESVTKPIIITHSNKQAFYLNQNIRTLLGNKNWFHLNEGALLMVAQNSYDVDLSNGDQVILKQVKFVEKRAGFTFLEVTVKNIHDQKEHKTYLLKEFLFRPEANLPIQDAKKLLIDFDKRARHRGHKRNSEEYKKMMMKDKFLNALRAKFGYAITCHKSQGGEWPHVFLNLSDTLDRLNGETRLRWLYTAVTRAQDKLDIKGVYRGNQPKKNKKR
ncbi:MAG: ATP-dependent RecD-like DNA helicase [Saprospiraceae bacterium]